MTQGIMNARRLTSLMRTVCIGLLALGLLIHKSGAAHAQTEVIRGTEIAPVFGSTASGKASYLRVFNTSESTGDVEVVFVSTDTGEELGRWSTSIPSLAAPQFTVSDLEAQATPMITSSQAANGYTLLVRSEFTGRLQHVVWNASAGSLTNMSSCGAKSFNSTRYISNVHTSRIGGYPSTLYVSNEQSSTRFELFRVYNAETGAYIGDWNNDFTEAAGVKGYAVADIETELGLTPDTTPLHLNFIRDTFGTGIMQHVVNNVDGGALTDMTQACFLDATADVNTPEVAGVPTELEFDPFYQKYVNAGGIPVVTSNKVPDAALVRAREIVLFMLRKRPDLHFNMVNHRAFVAILAETEVTRDIPEYANLVNTETVDWDVFRGLGSGGPGTRITSGAEENVLQYPTDIYDPGIDILLHEFAHSMIGLGILNYDERFLAELDEAYEAALASPAYAGVQSDGATPYALTNRDEYWAEGVMTYFGVKGCFPIATNLIGHSPCTREEQRIHDPALYELMRRVFTDDPYPALNP